jgi:hypothetical protein
VILVAVFSFAEEAEGEIEIEVFIGRTFASDSAYTRLR